jgi:sporulation protein YlmC with PRC-barrel domain
MKHVPLHASVECSDGKAGQVTAVIVDPETLHVTHLVVKEKKRPHTEYLVTEAEVAESSADLVRLACTRSELEDMQPFISTEYRTVEIPRYPDVGGGRYQTHQIYTTTVDRERVPLGEAALHAGAEVKATDGRVGQVAELLLDEDTEAITHFVLREHHWLRERDVILPLSAVDRVVEDTVYLTLDKDTISSMLDVASKE